MARLERIGWFGACLLLACSSRLGGGQADEDGDESTSTSTSTSTTGTTTDTTDTTETSTVSTSDGPETDDDGILWDVNGLPDHGALPPGPCPPFALGTDVTGEGPLGAFASNRAWMGGWGNTPRIVVFDVAADTLAEEEHAADNDGQLLDGPALVLYPDIDAVNLPQTVPIEVEHFVSGNSEWFMGELTVDSYSSDEATLEPIFLEGSLALWPDQNAQGVEGPLRVEYCARYNPQVWGE